LFFTQFKTNIDWWPRATIKNNAPQLRNVALVRVPSAIEQQCATLGHYFSLLPSALVNICIVFLTGLWCLLSYLSACESNYLEIWHYI